MREFEVYLSRKPTANAEQNARKRVEYVQAETKERAGEIALAVPRNAAFTVASVREGGK